MVSGGSVDGLVSGLDTSSLINQLMQAESAPQTALKTKVTSTQKVVSAYQAINTRMAAVLNAAKALTDTATWTKATANSSSTAVSASADGTNQSGTVTFDVKALAAAHGLVSKGTAAALTDSVVTGAVKINLDDGHGGTTVVPVTPADNSLQAVVTAINGTANAGVKAAAVQVAPGQYRLQVTRTATGALSDFTLSGLDGLGGGFDVSTTGADAQLHVGTGPGAYDVYSASNTFTGVLPGTTFTALRKEDGVTVSLSADAKGISSKVKALVDTVNSALGDIASATATDPDPAKRGILGGDFTLRQISNQLLSAVATGAGALGDLSPVGVQLKKDGTLSYDEAKFLASYQADPAKTQTYFTKATPAPPATPDGLAVRVTAIADTATHFGTGTLTTAIAGRNKLIDNLNTNVADWDVRLADKKASLQREFANLEVSLGKLKQQSSWLTGQIASLPSK